MQRDLGKEFELAKPNSVKTLSIWAVAAPTVVAVGFLGKAFASEIPEDPGSVDLGPNIFMTQSCDPEGENSATEDSPLVIMRHPDGSIHFPTTMLETTIAAAIAAAETEGGFKKLIENCKLDIDTCNRKLEPHGFQLDQDGNLVSLDGNSSMLCSHTTGPSYK